MECERRREGEPALTLRAAYKSYASQAVLRGLDMTVPQGCIYGLLGPSGCGKTTLFKCVMGLQQLDAGGIVVAARDKRNIGYMPQDLSLYMEFSIKETLMYYGMLYGMGKEDIMKRTEELVTLLSLPLPHITVNILSGGQKRRVSFAVALLHDPQLLVLDEPTVGLDPLLCHNIWQYLVHLTSNGKKSVVITTHYIEEARQAHVIGLMREGTLLAEDSPQTLMETHQSDSLERVFLTLSKAQYSTHLTQHKQTKSFPSLIQNKSKSPLNESSQISWYRVTAQNIKTLYWMWRNIPIMYFVMGLPIVQNLLYNACIGHDPRGLHLGYINDEVTRGVSGCRSVAQRGCHIDSLLSCRYLNTMENRGIVLKEFNSFEDGFSAVKENDVWGLLYYNMNYTSSYNTRWEMLTSTPDVYADLSEVKVWLDMSDQSIGNMLKRDLFFGFIEFQKALFADCGWLPDAGDIPIRFEKAVFGSNKLDFTNYATPAVITIGMFYMPMTFTIASLLAEKTQGLLDRNSVAGLTLIELVISHSMIQTVITIVHIVIVLIINYVYYDNVMVGSWPLFTLLLLAVGVCGMCYGFFISAVCRSDIEATVFGIGTFFPFTMISGMIWPIEGMHFTMRVVSELLPLTKATQSFRAIASRNWSFLHPAVYTGFLSCVVWVAVLVAASAAIVKWLNGTATKR